MLHKIIVVKWIPTYIVQEMDVNIHFYNVET